MTKSRLLHQANRIVEAIYKRDFKRRGSKVVTNIEVTRYKDFTTVLLNNKFTGVTKRNKVDKDDPFLAISTATWRAAKKMLGVPAY